MARGVRSELVQYKRKGRCANWADFNLSATTPDPMQLQTTALTLKDDKGREHRFCESSQGG